MLPKSEYTTLLKTIGSTFETGRDKAGTAGNEPILKANWQIGQLLDKSTGGEDRAPYAENLIDRISEDLNQKYGRGFSRRNLHYMRLFYRTYQQKQVQPTFRWSHYKLLLDQPETERKGLERRILREKLTPQQLRSLLKSTPGAWKGLDRPSGKVDSYRVKSSKFLNSAPTVHNLDLGFGVYANHLSSELEIPSGTKYFTVSKQKSGKFQLEEAEAGDLYLYRAIPERIVDGDTLIAQIETVFDIRIRVRLRLSGVEVPEKGSTTNETLKKYTENRLSKCRFILLKSHGKERFGRWLADVLYLPDTGSINKVLNEGKHLNAELIRKLGKK